MFALKLISNTSLVALHQSVVKPCAVSYAAPLPLKRNFVQIASFPLSAHLRFSGCRSALGRRRSAKLCAYGAVGDCNTSTGLAHSPPSTLTTPTHALDTSSGGICVSPAEAAVRSASDACGPPSTSAATGSPELNPQYCVVNFYHLCRVQHPEQTALEHKDFVREQGWDLRGRIYISSQGINAQFSGLEDEAIAYTRWVEQQPEFQGFTWRAYPAPRNMFPKLRLKYKPNLVSLSGGMADLPVTGMQLAAHISAIGMDAHVYLP